MNPPISFIGKLASPRSQGGKGYPYQIRAEDLDRNFYAATLIVEEKLVEQVGVGNFTQRRLKIPAGETDGQILYWNGTEYTLTAAPPSSGTHVLGSVNGNLQWIATEEC